MASKETEYFCNTVFLHVCKYGIKKIITYQFSRHSASPINKSRETEWVNKQNKDIVMLYAHLQCVYI